MGIGLVQSKGSASLGNTPISVVFTSNTTAGNLLIAQVGTYTNDAVSGITGGGGTWTLAYRENVSTGGTASCEIWYAPNVTGGSATITITTPGATGSTVAAAISEWSGLLASPFDQATGAANVAGQTPTTPAGFTPYQAGELIIATACADQQMSVGSYTNGFTEAPGMATLYSTIAKYVDGLYLIDSAGTAITAGFLGMGSSQHYSTCIAAFLSASAPLAGTVPPWMTQPMIPTLPAVPVGA